MRPSAWGFIYLSQQAGIMEEMLEDTLEMDDDEELEEEADAEVDKVLFELTNGKLGEAGSVGTGLPVRILAVDLILRSLNTYHRHWRTRWRRRRRKEIWRNTDNS
jgi:hypothetical protein